MMALMQDNQREPGKEKASGLTSSAYDRVSENTSQKGSCKSNRLDKKLGRGDGGRWSWRSLLLDLLVLVMCAALVTGGVFGYRALQKVYAPQWEEKTVEFCVRICNVDVAGIYDEEGNSLFENREIWHGDRAAGEKLGTVVSMTSSPDDENDKIATVYLTVRGEASYRREKGYYIGDMRLLAGSKLPCRVGGFMSEGEVISLHEYS